MALHKNKTYGKAAAWGMLSIVLYVALFKMEGRINETFGKGGLYAFLPILTAFLFSFIHGNFTGEFWSALGIEPSRKTREVK